MFTIKKIIIASTGVIILGNFAQASMLEQLIYNVAGQVTNATGARLGDEIYYGSSRGRAPARRHRRVKHKVRHKAKHKVKHKQVRSAVATPSVAKMTDEKRIQKALTSLGFYKGKIDGEINSFETRSAIKEMNIAYGISDNAFLKPEIRDTLIYLGTLFGFDRALIASGTDERTKAKKIQTALKIHGYYHDKIDGLIGSGTRSCISNYKNENGMSPSGTLNYEEEYKLISTAKEKNDKNIESSLSSLKSFGHRIAQPTVGVQAPGASTVSSTVQPQQKVVPQTAQTVQAIQKQVPATQVAPQTAQTTQQAPTTVQIAVPSPQTQVVTQQAAQVAQTQAQPILPQPQKIAQ